MTLVKWTPKRSLLTPFSVDSWINNVDSLFDSFIRRGFELPIIHNADWMPHFDLIESDKEYVIRVEAPGMKKSEFNIKVKDGVLTISGEKKAEEYNDREKYTYRESHYGRFSRSFRLPDEEMEKKVNASYKNGVLTVSIPRTKTIEAKEIEVEIS